MARLKRTLRRKAAKAAIEHSAHGVVAKVQRRPLRSAVLLSIGAAFGVAAGWLGGRKTTKST